MRCILGVVFRQVVGRRRHLRLRVRPPPDRGAHPARQGRQDDRDAASRRSSSVVVVVFVLVLGSTALHVGPLAAGLRRSAAPDPGSTVVPPRRAARLRHGLVEPGPISGGGANQLPALPDSAGVQQLAGSVPEFLSARTSTLGLWTSIVLPAVFLRLYASFRLARL